MALGAPKGEGAGAPNGDERFPKGLGDGAAAPNAGVLPDPNGDVPGELAPKGDDEGTAPKGAGAGFPNAGAAAAPPPGVEAGIPPKGDDEGAAAAAPMGVEAADDPKGDGEGAAPVKDDGSRGGLGLEKRPLAGTAAGMAEAEAADLPGASSRGFAAWYFVASLANISTSRPCQLEINAC